MKELLIFIGICIIIFIFLAKKFKFFESASIYQLRNSIYRKYIKYNVFLKSLTEEDARNLVKFVKKNKEGLDSIPYLTFLQDIEKVEKFCEAALEKSPYLSELYFVIYKRKYFIFKEVIGILFCEIKLFKTGYISYWLDKDSQGKGIMTLACKHFVKIAFESLRIKELIISARKTNLKSIAVAKRLGFKYYELEILKLNLIKLEKIATRSHFKMVKEDYFNNLRDKN